MEKLLIIFENHRKAINELIEKGAISKDQLKNAQSVSIPKKEIAVKLTSQLMQCSFVFI